MKLITEVQNLALYNLLLVEKHTLNVVTMKPAKPPVKCQSGLFKAPLELFIDMQQLLVGLANRVD